MLGGQAGTSRRIENYLGFPAGISGTRADQPRGHPGAQVRRPHGDALPGRSRSSPAASATWSGSRRATRSRRGRSLLATGAEYRRLPVDGPRRSTRGSASSTPPARPRRSSAAASASGSSAAATRPAQAAVWLARGGALVTLLHRRADLSETMSDYLIDELDRYGVAVRDRSEIAELHGERRPARGGDAHRRRPSCRSRFLFLFLGAVALHRLARRRASPATRRASSSPAPRPGPTACSRPASPASTPPATCAPARSSAARPRSARARPSCASSTSACRRPARRPANTSVSRRRAHRTPGRHTHWRLARRRHLLLRGGAVAALLAVVGPGLLAGLSDDDPAGITTYSILGAKYGYELLWVLALSTAALIVFHELGRAAGHRHRQGAADAGARALRAAAPPALVLGALVIANTGTLCAEFAGVAAAMELLGGMSRYVSVPLAAIGVSAAGPARELPPRRARPARAQLGLRRLRRLRASSPTPTGARPPRAWSCRACR